MLFREAQKTYLFPRIPLNFVIPDNYPEVGVISSISVIPEITGYRAGNEEFEIEGQYQLAVSYYKADNDAGSSAAELKELEFETLVSSRNGVADGLFNEGNNEARQFQKTNSSELYTVHFSRPFHTYVELEFITKPRTFRPGMVVEKIELEPIAARKIKGALELGLVNRPRRNSW